MDWPEGDEDGCFRLADAFARAAQDIMAQENLAAYAEPGDDWDGDALKALVQWAEYDADPTLRELIRQLVSAALHYNDLGVQVQYTKRMIEVSVWFLILQLTWLLAAATGPWGALSLSVAGARIQLTRLAIAQLGKRLLINIGLFGGLMAGMDLAVQSSQSRRDHLDWEQILMSGGTGAVLGAFLTGFTGIVPARSIWGLMSRSALASASTDLTVQLGSGQPLDWDRLFKSLTSGALGGADAHWASWSPFAHGKPETGSTGGPASPLPHGTVGEPGQSLPSSSHPHTSGHSPGHHPSGPPVVDSPPPQSTSLSSAPSAPDKAPSGQFPQSSASHPSARTDGDATTFAGASAKQDVSFKSGPGVDAMINNTRAADPPAPAHAGDGPPPTPLRTADGTDPVSAKPAGLGPSSLPGQAPSPFQILENPGRSGDGYVSGGLWGKYGAAGVLIRGIDDAGVPRYLLMQQSQYVSNAGKWQLPGGALDSLESPVQGAARELSEELGVDQSYLNTLKLKGEHAVEVGDSGWKYTNLAAEGPLFTPKLDTFETAGAKWFTLQELASLANDGKLHPALAKALPDVLALYHQDAGTPPAAAAPAAKDHYTASATTHAIKPPVDFGAHTPANPLDGKPTPAYSGLTADGPNPSAGHTIHSTDSGLYYTAPAPHVPLDAPFGSHIVGPAFGDAIWTDVYANLTAPEQKAAEYYAGNGFEDMNGYLRQGNDFFANHRPYYDALIRERIIKRVELLSAVTSRQPVPTTIDVFRSVELTSDLFTVPIHELPGTVQRDPAFFSTNLGDEPVFGKNVNLHLRVPPGTPAFYLQLVSRLGEWELLLGNDVSWYAEDVQRRDGKWHVYGWVLPPEESGTP
ncbi:NUDIX domain-containing protein [Nonomuraea sp. NPDC050783]|uniref:NUDIX domain-containing protein n=1 Tax=Nonomuraea sp. NPDC050783 TaxID=3154634 RepID=UPI00346594DF